MAPMATVKPTPSSVMVAKRRRRSAPHPEKAGRAARHRAHRKIQDKILLHDFRHESAFAINAEFRLIYLKIVNMLFSRAGATYITLIFIITTSARQGSVIHGVTIAADASPVGRMGRFLGFISRGALRAR